MIGSGDKQTNMLVTLILSSALATPSSVMEERLVLARGIDALYSGDLAASESYLTSIVADSLLGEASFWLSEIHLRNRDFQAALSSLAQVDDDFPRWRVDIVEAEARMASSSGVDGLREVIEGAWSTAGGDSRSFGVGACFAQVLVQSGELNRAGEVLRAIGGDPDRILPSWLREACAGPGSLLVVPATEGTAGAAFVTILGQRWAWDIASGVLVSSVAPPTNLCELPPQYNIGADSLDLSLSCVGEQVWFVRHSGGESSLWRVDGAEEVSFEMTGMVPATVSARLLGEGVELLLGGVVEGEPVVALWDGERGMRLISTGDWVLTSPSWGN